jgi:hypothetical protein
MYVYYIYDDYDRVVYASLTKQNRDDLYYKIRNEKIDEYFKSRHNECQCEDCYYTYDLKYETLEDLLKLKDEIEIEIIYRKAEGNYKIGEIELDKY